MFIANLDFLNSPPQLYILNKKTNKTLLGGILFFIYFLLMLTIVIFYVFNYYLNDKYSIRYSHYIYYKNQEELFNQNNDRYNNFNFSFNFHNIKTDRHVEDLNADFLFLDFDLNVLRRNTYINSKIKNTTYFIAYFCFGNCSSDSSDDELVYSIEINYTGYKIDHQNENIPLETNNLNHTFTKELFFSLDKTDIFRINFEIIKYKEEKGLLGLFDNWMNNSNEYSCIDIESVEKTESKNYLSLEFGEGGLKFVIKILGTIEFNSDKYVVEEYIRNKKSLLDILANIGSLFSTFLTIFSFFFKFYSRKNDNYTIIKELLSSPRISSNSNINTLNSKTIKFENIPNKNKNYLSFDKKSIDTSKSVPLKTENDNILNKKKITKNNEKQNQHKDDIIYLHKISFIDFLLDNFKCKKYKKKKNSLIIDTCDKIISKYSSVETILYNQLIFENLLKDYELNDPSINKISNNFLIQRLKSINMII